MNKNELTREQLNTISNIYNTWRKQRGPSFNLNELLPILNHRLNQNVLAGFEKDRTNLIRSYFVENGNEWVLNNPYEIKKQYRKTQYPKWGSFKNDDEYYQQYVELNPIESFHRNLNPTGHKNQVLMTSPYFGKDYTNQVASPLLPTPTGVKFGAGVYNFKNTPQASVQTNQQPVVQQPTTPVQQPVQTTVNPAKKPVAKPAQQVQTQPKPQTEEEAFAERVKQLRGDGKPVPPITHEKLLEYTGRLAQPLPSLNGMAPPKGMPYIPKPNPVEQQQTQQSTTDPSTPWYKKLGSIGKSVYNNLPTFGDAMSVYGMYTGMQNAKNAVLADRATDTPNKNYYANYGLAGLSALDTQKQFINRQYDYMNSDLSRRYDQILAQNRGSSMGINQMRAGDMAGLGMLAGQRAQMDTQRFGSLAQLAQQRMQLQNQRDAYLAQGEQARDLADRQDKSAFYTNWAQAQNNYSQGLMHLGGMFNHFAGERAKQNILNQYSKFGIYSDRYGNLYANDRDD